MYFRFAPTCLAVLWVLVTVPGNAASQASPAAMEKILAKGFDVAFSPDGAHFVTAQDDFSLVLWSADSGKELAEIQGHTDVVNTVEFSRDGTRLVSASADGTARVWAVNNGEELLVLNGHQGVVHTAQFSSSGGIIVTASDDGSVRIWLSANGELLHELDAQGDGVPQTAFSPDGTLLVTNSSDGSVRMWNLADLNLKPELVRAATSALLPLVAATREQYDGRASHRELSELQQAYTKAREQLDAKERWLSEAEGDLADTRRLLELATAELQKRGSQMAKQQAEIEALAATNASFVDFNKDGLQQRDEIRLHLVETEQQLAESARFLDETTAQLAVRDTAIRDQQALIGRLERQVADSSGDDILPQVNASSVNLQKALVIANEKRQVSEALVAQNIRLVASYEAELAQSKSDLLKRSALASKQQQQLGDLLSERDGLEKALAEQAGQVDTFQSERTQLELLVIDARADLQDRDRALVEVRTELDNLTHELSSTNAQLLARDLALVDSQARLRTREQSLSDTGRRLSDNDDSIATLTHDVSRLTSERDQLLADIQSAEQRAQEVDSLLLVRNAALVDAQVLLKEQEQSLTDLRSAGEKLVRLEVNLGDKSSALTTAERQLLDTQRLLVETRSVLLNRESQQALLEAQLAERVASVAALTQDLSKLTGERDGLSVDVQSESRRAEDAETQLSLITTQLEDRDTGIASLAQDMSTLTCERDALITVHQSAYKRAETAESQLKSIATQLNGRDVAIAAIEQGMAVITNERDVLAEEVKSVQQRALNTASQLQLRDVAFSELEILLEQKDQSLVALQSTDALLSQAQLDLSDTTRALAEANRQLADSGAGIAILNAERDALSADVITLERRVEDTESQLKDRDAAIAFVNQDIATISIDRDRLAERAQTSASQLRARDVELSAMLELLEERELSKLQEATQILSGRDARIENLEQLVVSLTAERDDLARGQKLQIAQQDAAQLAQIPQAALNDAVSVLAVVPRELATAAVPSPETQSVATVGRTQAEKSAASNAAEILATLQRWADAWSGQNAEAYLGHYDESFRPVGGGSHGPGRIDAPKKFRNRRIST